MADTSSSDPVVEQPAVEQSVDIEAAPDEVWHTLTDPDELSRWLDAEVDLDLEPGSVGRVVHPDGTVHQVLVTEVEPPHRLAWHWWEDGGDLSTVEITVTPTGTGSHVQIVECRSSASPRASASAGPSARSMRWQRSLVLLSAQASNRSLPRPLCLR